MLEFTRSCKMEKKREKASKGHVLTVGDGRYPLLERWLAANGSLLNCREPVLSHSGGTTGPLVDLEFKVASLAFTVEAIIADNWSGTCCPVYEVGDAFLGGE